MKKYITPEVELEVISAKEDILATSDEEFFDNTIDDIFKKIML